MTVARHVQAAGDQLPVTERAPALRSGGDAALDLTLWNEAAQLLEASCAADPPSATADVLASLGRAYYFDHDLDAAAPALRRAVGAADEAGREDVWADALFMLLRMMLMSSTAAWRRPDDDELMQRYLSVATDPAGRAMLLEVQAEAQLAAGRVEAGERTAREAIALAEASGRPEIQAFAYYALSFADATAMRMYEALDGGRKALLHARASADWYIRDTVATRLSFPLLATGELDDADELALDCVERATATHEHSNLSLGLATVPRRRSSGVTWTGVDHLVQARRGRSPSPLRHDRTLHPRHRLPRPPLSRRAPAGRAGPRALAHHPEVGPARFRMMFDAVGAPPPSPLGHDLRPPSAPTQVAAGYFIAALDGALIGRRFVPPTDVRMVVERWHEGGLGTPPATRRHCRVSAPSWLPPAGTEEAGALFSSPSTGAGAGAAPSWPGSWPAGPVTPEGRRRESVEPTSTQRARELAGASDSTTPSSTLGPSSQPSSRKRSVAGRAGHRHRRVNGHQQRAGRRGLPGSRPSPPHHRAPVAGAARRARVQRGR